MPSPRPRARATAWWRAAAWNATMRTSASPPAREAGTCPVEAETLENVKKPWCRPDYAEGVSRRRRRDGADTLVAPPRCRYPQSPTVNRISFELTCGDDLHTLVGAESAANAATTSRAGLPTRCSQSWLGRHFVRPVSFRGGPHAFMSFMSLGGFSRVPVVCRRVRHTWGQSRLRVGWGGRARGRCIPPSERARCACHSAPRKGAPESRRVRAPCRRDAKR